MAEPDEPRVLIVEDDDGIAVGLVRALGVEGYRSVRASTAAEALQLAAEHPDLVLLDLGLPDMDGLDLCRQLRQALPDTPIVMLTARGTETDIVVGLDAGADDYLTKPFRLAELHARLRAHTRRRRAQPAEASDTITIADVTIDLGARRVWVAGSEVDLRPKEFDLLAVLMRHAGRVVTRSELMDAVWDEHWFGSTKTLDVHVASLRQRLGDTSPETSRITTLRGVGYRLEPSEDRSGAETRSDQHNPSEDRSGAETRSDQHNPSEDRSGADGGLR